MSPRSVRHRRSLRQRLCRRSGCPGVRSRWQRIELQRAVRLGPGVHASRPVALQLHPGPGAPVRRRRRPVRRLHLPARHEQRPDRQPGTACRRRLPGHAGRRRPRHPLRRLRPEQHLFQRTRRGWRAQAGLAHRARLQPDLPAHRHYPDPGRLPLFHRRLPRTRRRARLARRTAPRGHLGFRQLQAAQPVQPAGEPGPRRLRQPLSFRLLQRFLRRQEPRHPIAVRLPNTWGS